MKKETAAERKERYNKRCRYLHNKILELKNREVEVTCEAFKLDGRLTVSCELDKLYHVVGPGSEIYFTVQKINTIDGNKIDLIYNNGKV